MNEDWERLEPIRIRIMSEAYDLADRDDSEGYNSVKVMCSDVLAMIETAIATEREMCAKVCDFEIDEWGTDTNGAYAAKNCAAAIRSRGEK